MRLGTATSVRVLIAVLSGWIAAAPVRSEARVITYRDGTRVYFDSTGLEREVAVDYSLTGAAALGFEGGAHESNVIRDERTLLFRWSQVVYRLNGEGFQASLNSRLGVGYLLSADHDDRSHVQAGLGLDAETRRFFILAEYSAGASPRLSPLAKGIARVGVAPFVSEYAGLHAWVFAHLEYLSLHGDPLTRIGPVVRVTYLNFQLELGHLSTVRAARARQDVTLALEMTF